MFHRPSPRTGEERDSLVAGRHAITATNKPTPVKQPLAILGLAAIVALLVPRGGLDWQADWLAAALSRVLGRASRPLRRRPGAEAAGTTA